MKYDSYSRFLKSQMYKDCIVHEMEGKSVSQILDIVLNNNGITKTTAASVNGSNSNINNAQSASSQHQQENNSTGSNSTKDTKKRSTILPWTKGKHKSLNSHV